jgi:hypothetical protein
MGNEGRPPTIELNRRHTDMVLYPKQENVTTTPEMMVHLRAFLEGNPGKYAPFLPVEGKTASGEYEVLFATTAAEIAQVFIPELLSAQTDLSQATASLHGIEQEARQFDPHRAADTVIAALESKNPKLDLQRFAKVVNESLEKIFYELEKAVDVIKVYKATINQLRAYTNKVKELFPTDQDPQADEATKDDQLVIVRWQAAQEFLKQFKQWEYAIDGIPIGEWNGGFPGLRQKIQALSTDITRITELLGTEKKAEVLDRNKITQQLIELATLLKAYSEAA